MSDEERTKLKDQGKVLKDKLAVLEEQAESLEAELQAEGQKLPNQTHPEVINILDSISLILMFMCMTSDCDNSMPSICVVDDSTYLLDGHCWKFLAVPLSKEQGTL